jgi:hypothetical protein
MWPSTYVDIVAAVGMFSRQPKVKLWLSLILCKTDGECHGFQHNGVQQLVSSERIEYTRRDIILRADSVPGERIACRYVS